MWFISKTIKIQIICFMFSVHLNLGLGLGQWSFIWFRAFFKVYAFQNSKLIKPITLNYNHYTKAWLRLMYPMNSAENQDFLVWVLCGF